MHRIFQFNLNRVAVLVRTSRSLKHLKDEPIQV